MKGKASASIFSFQGHIIILRLLSFFIKLFIRFISNSPDFKMWILWLQKRPNQSPLIAKLYHYTIPRPLGKHCEQCQRHSLYVFQRFCLLVLKEKKNCDENRFIKSNLCRQHLVRWKCCLTLTIPWNTNSLNWNYRGKIQPPYILISSTLSMLYAGT